MSQERSHVPEASSSKDDAIHQSASLVSKSSPDPLNGSRSEAKAVKSSTPTAASSPEHIKEENDTDATADTSQNHVEEVEPIRFTAINASTRAIPLTNPFSAPTAPQSSGQTPTTGPNPPTTTPQSHIMCPVPGCSKTFTRKSSLALHMNTHSQAK
ncbi:MAG: hypothetical protein Q9183_005747, partial [Haloplaca sp. 2 TL-2023]